MFRYLRAYFRWRLRRPRLAPHDSWPIRKASWEYDRPRYRRMSRPYRVPAGTPWVDVVKTMTSEDRSRWEIR